mgnify:CR=1 FL=1
MNILWLRMLRLRAMFLELWVLRRIIFWKNLTAVALEKNKANHKRTFKEDRTYEKFLITTSKVELEGINAISFDKVMFEFISKLDRQYYSNNSMRTLQLVKCVLLANPRYTAKMIGDEEKFNAEKS